MLGVCLRCNLFRAHGFRDEKARSALHPFTADPVTTISLCRVVVPDVLERQSGEASRQLCRAALRQTRGSLKHEGGYFAVDIFRRSGAVESGALTESFVDGCEDDAVLLSQDGFSLPIPQRLTLDKACCPFEKRRLFRRAAVTAESASECSENAIRVGNEDSGMCGVGDREKVAIVCYEESLESICAVGESRFRIGSASRLRGVDLRFHCSFRWDG